ncbi:rRNA methyltransferase 3, mitochondrial [Lingula anatina]|uniref:rRNA methyltransferase 3, mitochondrial n=1 Tax=Lingula anatina TaxID=7574 RepID=A0A1S3HNE7_LINAN|nr:rRNA methyltransferase 3, mitochondrial [Lingula anatina]|eukprot:XP_013387570.1 rRNA methyltransferase 3, mitochondrial [Lingula anatina]
MRRKVITVMTPQEEEELRKQQHKRHIKPIEKPREWKDLHPRERKAFTTPSTPKKPQKFKKFSKSSVAPPVIGSSEDQSNAPKHSVKVKPLRYEMLKELDPRFGYIMQHTRTAYSRKKHDIILVQGEALILRALEAGLIPKSIFFSGDSKVMLNVQEKLDTLTLSKKKIPNVYGVKKQSMQLWCNADETPNVVGIFRMPLPERIGMQRQDVCPITLICDGVTDPASMVTLLQAAAAARVDKILLAEGCIDVWDLQVVQAGKGCQFHIPIVQDVTVNSLISHLDEGTKVHVLDCADWSPREASPMDPAMVESLIQESEDDADMPEENKIIDDQDLMKYEQLSFEIKEYYKVDFTRGKTAIVIVNTAVNNQHISAHAFLNKLLFDYGGQKICVPTLPDSGETIVGNAVTVVAFEMKKQLDTKEVKNE